MAETAASSRDHHMEADQFDVGGSRKRHVIQNGVADCHESIFGDGNHHPQFHSCPVSVVKPSRCFRSSPPGHVTNSETHHVSPSRVNGDATSSTSSSPVLMSSTPPSASDLGFHAGRRRFNTVGSGGLTRQLTPDQVHPGPGGTINALPVTCRRLRVSRDATQPSTGSMRSLRSASNDGSSIDEDDEETDEFPNKRWSVASSGSGGPPTGSTSLSHRPRAATCPETKAFRRRALARAMNRPPTPTPTDDPVATATSAAVGLPAVVAEEEYCVNEPAPADSPRLHHRSLQRHNEVEPVAVAQRSSSADTADSCSWKLSELGFSDRHVTCSTEADGYEFSSCSWSPTSGGDCCYGSPDLLPVITEST